MRRTQHLKNEEGSVAVEFAILVPILLLITFGIIYFGYLFGVSHSLQLVAAEATRASVRGVTTAERLQFAEDALEDAVANNPFLSANRLAAAFSQTTVPFAGMVVTVTYDLNGTLVSNLPFVESSLGETLVREAYIAY